jgi:Fe2+ or Zn2+ uptake regulation protein
VALIQDENVLHTELVISVKTILEKLDEAAKQQLTEPTNYSNLRYFLDHGIPKSVSLIE